MPNFKSPVPNGIPSFCLKQIDSLHVHYARAFNELIPGEQEMDELLTEGSTFLIPKSKEIQLPHTYRPMTTYELLRGIITETMYHHLTEQGGQEAEQKGCK